MDGLVDNTVSEALLSFVDGYAGFNHVRILVLDIEKTTFITPWGTYCYMLMLFGLEYAKATYQKTSTTVLYDFMK